MKKLLILFMPLFLMRAQEIPLMKDGRPACSIILNSLAGPVEKHAAAELSKYLGKIAGGDAPMIGGNLYPLRYELITDSKLAIDGFIIKNTPVECVIQARIPLGFLYGSYEILKQYGGIRWLVPGEDGEYFKVRPTIAIPVGTIKGEPSFQFRTISWGGAYDSSPKFNTLDWMVRNNLCIYDNSYIYFQTRYDMDKEMAKRGAEILDGGHCFSDLLGGWRLKDETTGKEITYAQSVQNLKDLFNEHPEYFPMINGKRVPMDGHKYQPCTTHPDVIRIMGRNLALNWQLWTSKTLRSEYRLVNNDGTGWCQCEQCRESDPETDNYRGEMTHRYWTFMNVLAKEARKTAPDIRLRTIAYQNYQDVPKNIRPDPEFMVDLSYNRICYRHNINDPNCPTNRLYCRMYQDWSKEGIPLTAYGQIDAAAGMVFMPIEETFTHDIKFYHKLGFIGIRPQFSPVDGIYGKSYEGSMAPLEHHAMWQTVYMFALHAWNINADYDKIYEEINSLYYGKGWAGGMGDFRKLLIKAASETPGCYGHGHSSPLGRCLEGAGVKKNLLRYLAAAEKAATSDPDPRALQHVQRDKDFFMRTWVRFHDEYRKNYKEINSYRRTKPIRIDAILDEWDWKNADTVSGFRQTNIDNKLAVAQTYVKIIHEPENICFGIEALEPEPEKMMTSIEKHDGPVWEDNTLEIMINHPDLGNSYYHFIFNAAGICFDRYVKAGSEPDAGFSGGAEVKTSIHSDRWILEVRIPTAPLGNQCFDGRSWKVNVLRARKIRNKEGSSSGTPTESSTWSMGRGQGVALFHPVNFCAKRVLVGQSRGDERDSRIWRNGSLNEPAANPMPPRAGWEIKDGLLPAYWGTAGQVVDMEYLPEEGNTGGHYLRIRKATLLNEYRGPTGKTQIYLNHRGPGKVYLRWLLYRETRETGRTLMKSIEIAVIDPSEEWETKKLTTDLSPCDLAKLSISMDHPVDLDEVLVFPFAE